MTWELTLFYWTGWICIMLILLTILCFATYYIFNAWLNSLRYFWKVVSIAYMQKNKGDKFWDKTFTDRDGTKFKIVKLEDEK